MGRYCNTDNKTERVGQDRELLLMEQAFSTVFLAGDEADSFSGAENMGGASSCTIWINIQ